MAKTKANPKSARKRKTGGSRFGTRWVSSRDGVCVSWPTIPWAGTGGCYGLAASIFMWTLVFFIDEKFMPRWVRWEWTLLVTILSITLLVSSQLLRESFSISRQKAERTRWPGRIRPRQAVPRDRVISVIVQLDEHIRHDADSFGGDVRHVGTVKVRVRRPDGIDWWKLGWDLHSAEAVSIGKRLSRFVDVRVIESK